MNESRLRDARILWVVPGLLAEGRRVALELFREKADVVAVGVSPEEAEGLAHFVAEPVEDDGWWTETFALALSRFGPVGFPPPAYVEAARFAVEAGLPLEGVDLAQDDYDERYTKAVTTWQWWRHGRRMRKLEKRPPRAASPEAFATAWDAKLRSAGRGVRGIEDAREEAIVARLAALAPKGRVVAVLDVTQRAGVLSRAEGS